MKLIVAGGRDFKDYELLKEKLDFVLGNAITEGAEIEIVSGTANGADKLGERYAEERGYKIKRFPADWETHGKFAGFLRNQSMAAYATHCICFWDGKSRGTEHMISLAKEFKLHLRIVPYKIGTLFI